MDSYEKLRQNIRENKALKILCKSSEISYKCDIENETQTYTCGSCEDRFCLKSSYDYHIKRFSCKINYFCAECNISMSFTNKCALRLHVNSHGKKCMDLSKIIVKAPEMSDLLLRHANFFDYSTNTTVHKMVDKCKKTYSNIEQSTVSVSTNNNETNITTPVETRVDTEINVPIEKNVISENQDYTCCPVCHTLFKKCGESLTRELITEHFQYLDDSENLHNMCRTCNRFLPNKCAMIAHEEYHKKSSPFICPECGMTFVSFSLLEKHTKLTCFHDYRHMVVKCVAEGCSSMCFELDINKHFASHTKLIIQCAECAGKFDNKAQLIAHSKSVHNEELASGQSVYECMVCEQVIAKEDTNHALSHFGDAIKANYLYACDGCKFYFSKIFTFKQHLAKCSPHQRKVNPNGKTTAPSKSNIEIKKRVRVKTQKTNRKSVNKNSDESTTVTPLNVNSETVRSTKDDSTTDDPMTDNPKINEKVIRNDLSSTYDAVENVGSDITNSIQFDSSQIEFEFIEVSENNVIQANAQDEVINEIETDFIGEV